VLDFYDHTPGARQALNFAVEIRRRMTSHRLLALDNLAAKIGGISLGRPVRIAIDGRTAAGKTTLSDELAVLIGSRGRPVIRTSIDDFHRPKAERYARGRYSVEGYYYDARDLSALVNLLLIPLGPRGDGTYRTASFDLENDRRIEQEPRQVPIDAVLIVDGTFLQRPELREHWDLTVFVKTSADTAELRAVGRDAAQFGGVDAARKLYAERYRGAFDLYESLCAPEEIADVVLTNDNLDRPEIVIRADCLLAPPQSF
jgi:uridine kinase